MSADRGQARRRAARRGAVYDRGYRPYEGPRGGQAAATYALYKASIRRALGLRRSWRQKVAPFVLLGVVTIPAIINVGIGYVTRNQVIDRVEIVTYRDYVGVSSALLLFVALVAPDVVCPDRRQHVLPLMFARPLTGVDYVVAKVGAIATILFAFSFLPQVVLFVGNMLVSDSALEYFRGHLDVLWKVPLAVVLLAVYYAVIGVAIASLTDRRIVAGAAVIGLFLVTSIASGILVEGRRTARSPRCSTCWRCRCTCATSSSSATSTRRRRSAASPTAACSPLPSTSSCWSRAPPCCCGATDGSSDERRSP